MNEMIEKIRTYKDLGNEIGEEIWKQISNIDEIINNKDFKTFNVNSKTISLSFNKNNCPVTLIFQSPDKVNITLSKIIIQELTFENDEVCKSVDSYLMSTKGTYLKSWLPNDY